MRNDTEKLLGLAFGITAPGPVVEAAPVLCRTICPQNSSATHTWRLTRRRRF